MFIYKTELVVASYKENLEWIKKINCIEKITVYNRDPNCKYEGAINVPLCGGREAYMFAAHIILNYNNLADHTIFVQGNPFEQLGPPGVINENNFNELLANREYKPFHEPVYWKSKCPFRGGDLIYDYTPLCKAAYAECFEGPVPDIYFCPGGQWIVPRLSILSKSLKFYETIKEKLTPIRSHNEDGVINAWTLEGIWNYVYDPNVKEKYEY